MPEPMRYFIIINPPQYRDNGEDEHGFGWAGDAADEDEAKLLAIADCEASNDWEPGEIDAEDTHVIECGPDYRHTFEALTPALDELLAYQAKAFAEDTPLDLADLCTAFGHMRAKIKAALGRELEGVETSYDLKAPAYVVYAEEEA